MVSRSVCLLLPESGSSHAPENHVVFECSLG